MQHLASTRLRSFLQVLGAAAVSMALLAPGAQALERKKAPAKKVAAKKS